MVLSNKKGIQQIVKTLSQQGVREVILCPGSRDAPLIISFNRHPDIHCTSIRDERSAAFFAMGKALVRREPVAMVCTSGSAALNFAPALSEAYYQRIPLIILTADRPKEWTDQGDGQTINQTEVYHNFIRKSFELKGDVRNETEEWFNRRTLNEGFHVATTLDPGPVHFNIPLAEPLYDTEEVEKTQEGLLNVENTDAMLSAEGCKRFADLFSKSKKVMLLVGQRTKDKSLQEELVKLSVMDNVIILTESTSNLHHPRFIENIDRLITNIDAETAEHLMPDLLVTVGGAVVSKRIKKLLRKYPAAYHWNIHPFEFAMDTYQCLTNAVPLDSAAVFQQIRPSLSPVSSDYRYRWLSLKEKRTKRHHLYAEKCRYSDFKVFDLLFKNLPGDYQVHWSNSSAIRYAQLFDNTGVEEAWCNRGTSGIDGSTSTAVGAASGAPEKQFLLVTGDMAFHYDINALWNEEEVDNLKIIVINNGGGGIFRIIPGPDKVGEREAYFEAGMQSDIKDVARHYQWGYLSAVDERSLKEAMSVFFRQETRKTILEIFTNSKENPLVLEQYWKFLRDHTTEC